jgi:hypothetical protein
VSPAKHQLVARARAPDKKKRGGRTPAAFLSLFHVGERAAKVASIAPPANLYIIIIIIITASRPAPPRVYGFVIGSHYDVAAATLTRPQPWA